MTGIINSLCTRSVVEIWEFMQHYSGIKLLMGDMNAEPDSKTIRYGSKTPDKGRLPPLFLNLLQ